MDSTTGGDANDEFARWLAEQQGAAAPAQPTQAQPPVTPAAAPPPAPATPVAQPPAAPPTSTPAQPSAPEFFGADQLAAPPARAYEPQLGGPHVARTSFQAPGDPAAPAAAPPAAPTAAPTSPPAGVPPVSAPPASAPPAWAPGYSAPGAAPAATPPAAAPPAAAPSQPAAPPQFFPDAATPAAPPAPPSFDQPVAPTAVYPTTPAPSAGPDYAAPAAPPSFDVPPSFDAPIAPAPAAQPPAAPTSFDPPTAAYPAPLTDAGLSAFPPVAPATPPPAMPPADPYGALFATDGVDDTAARLAASPPPVASPDTGELAVDDPLKSLFGLETEEQPMIDVTPVAETLAPPVFTPEPAAPAAPVFPADPVYTADPVSTPEPAYVPEPTFAGAPAPEAPFGAAPPASSSYGLTNPSAAPSDDDPNAGTQFFGGGAGEWEEPPNLDRTTLGERIAFILAFLIPPAGLIASIVAAVQSSRERGWVHRFVKAGLVISVILSVVAGFAGVNLYKALDDARKHDAIAAASTQFCQTVADRPDMISPPAFGFPAPAASIPDTLAAIQEYVDRWDALATVSPSGIRPDVKRVADAASGILDTVTESRLVDNDQNVQVMSSVANSTQIVGWAEEYCG